MIAKAKRQEHKLHEVLLIEDNSGDVVLIRESLKDFDMKIRIHVARDGEQALARLSETPRPDLILLDINLPKKSGLEVLQEIRKVPGLRSIPVVVLTTSHSDKDILRSYGLGAECFVTKPMGFYEYMASIRSIAKNFLR